MIVPRHVRELRTRHAVPHGEHAGLGRLVAFVDEHVPRVVERDVARAQPRSFVLGVRPVATKRCEPRSVPTAACGGSAVVRRSSIPPSTRTTSRDAAAERELECPRRGTRRRAPQRAASSSRGSRRRGGRDERHLRAEAPKHLAQLARDVTRAQDQEPRAAAR